MAGTINVEYTEADIRQLIIADLRQKMPAVKIEPHLVNVEVKSKQNYRSEWEVAAFRGRVSVYLA